MESSSVVVILSSPSTRKLCKKAPMYTATSTTSVSDIGTSDLTDDVSRTTTSIIFSPTESNYSNIPSHRRRRKLDLNSSDVRLEKKLAKLSALTRRQDNSTRYSLTSGQKKTTTLKTHPSKQMSSQSRKNSRSRRPKTAPQVPSKNLRCYLQKSSKIPGLSTKAITSRLFGAIRGFIAKSCCAGSSEASKLESSPATEVTPQNSPCYTIKSSIPSQRRLRQKISRSSQTETYRRTRSPKSTVPSSASPEATMLDFMQVSRPQASVTSAGSKPWCLKLPATQSSRSQGTDSVVISPISPPSSERRLSQPSSVISGHYVSSLSKHLRCSSSKNSQVLGYMTPSCSMDHASSCTVHHKHLAKQSPKNNSSGFLVHLPNLSTLESPKVTQNSFSKRVLLARRASGPRRSLFKMFRRSHSQCFKHSQCKIAKRIPIPKRPTSVPVSDHPRTHIPECPRAHSPECLQNQSYFHMVHTLSPHRISPTCVVNSKLVTKTPSSEAPRNKVSQPLSSSFSMKYRSRASKSMSAHETQFSGIELSRLPSRKSPPVFPSLVSYGSSLRSDAISPTHVRLLSQTLSSNHCCSHQSLTPTLQVSPCRLLHVSPSPVLIAHPRTSPREIAARLHPTQQSPPASTIEVSPTTSLSRGSPPRLVLLSPSLSPHDRVSPPRFKQVAHHQVETNCQHDPNHSHYVDHHHYHLWNHNHHYHHHHHSYKRESVPSSAGGAVVTLDGTDSVTKRAPLGDRLLSKPSPT